VKALFIFIKILILSFLLALPISQVYINIFKIGNHNNKSISIREQLSQEDPKYIQCTNCPTLTKYYLNEILENTSQSFDMSSEFLDHKVALKITKDPEVITREIDKSINYEFHGLNTNDNILIYIDPSVSNLEPSVIETPDIYNKYFYGLLVHEITHSMQYNFYKQPRTAIIPNWYKEGQAEYERYKQLDLNLPQTVETDDSYLSQYIDLVRERGEQKATFLPFYLEDGISFQELVSNKDL
jgi:predicted transcriptional regulator